MLLLLSLQFNDKSNHSRMSTDNDRPEDDLNDTLNMGAQSNNSDLDATVPAAHLSEQQADLADTMNMGTQKEPDLQDTLQMGTPQASSDLQDTVPMAAQNPDLDATVPMSSQTTTASPEDPNATVPMSSANQTALPAADTMLNNQNQAETMPAAGQTGTLEQTAATNAFLDLTGGASTAGMSRTGRTRLNVKLPPDTQQLDQSLQLSRQSVFVDMLQARGPVSLPNLIREKLEKQDTVGRYIINRPLAQGGMGAVLDINDGDFQRKSAMKVIHARFANDPESLERFLEEAQITAQLEHPNIVPIHDVGVMSDGTLFYTMKMIHGDSLGTVVKRLKEQNEDYQALWTNDHILLTFLKILDGMSFAHTRGVVHRDIKPDNIMVEHHGEVLVVDWGIAKVLELEQEISEDAQSLADIVNSLRDENAMSATQTGAAMGTPYYMPPEQALGKKNEIDARSDIYALGATLYEMLCQHRPIEVKNIHELIAAKTSGAFTPLNEHNDTFNQDLVAIVHKAMEHKPENRYQNCEEFSEDIKRYLAGQAVIARKRNFIERVGAWVQAHKTQCIVAAVMILLLGGGIGGTLYTQQQNRLGEAQALFTQAQADAQNATSVDELQSIKESLLLAEDKVPDLPGLSDLKATIAAQLVSAKMKEQQELARTEAQNALKKAQALLAALDRTDSAVAEQQLQEAKKHIDVALELDSENEDIRAAYDIISAQVHDLERARLQAVALEAFKKGDALLTEAEATHIPILTPTEIETNKGNLSALITKETTLLTSLKSVDTFFETAQQNGSGITGLDKRIQAAGQLRAIVTERMQANRSQAEAYNKSQNLLAEAKTLAKGATDLQPAINKLIESTGAFYTTEADTLKSQYIARNAAIQRMKNLAIITAYKKQGDDQLGHAKQAGAGTSKCEQALTAAKAFYDKAHQFEENDNLLPSGLSEQEQTYTAMLQTHEHVVLTERNRTEALATAHKNLLIAQENRAQSLKLSDTIDATQQRIAFLQNKLYKEAAEQKNELWDARNLLRQQQQEIIESTTSAAKHATLVLSQLAAYPEETDYTTARLLLTEMIWERLQDAQKRQALAEVIVHRKELQRYDTERTYLTRLDAHSSLQLTGTAGTVVSIRARQRNRDGRFSAGEEIQSITLPSTTELPAGSYIVQSPTHNLPITLQSGADKNLFVPSQILEQVSVPAIKTTIPVQYVPAIDGGKGFLLSTYEISNAQYYHFIHHVDQWSEIKTHFEQMMNAEGLNELVVPYVPRNWEFKGSKYGLQEKVLSNGAVSSITIESAKHYCSWLSKHSGLNIRLPTKQEWQQAATAGDSQRIWPWGDTFDLSFAVSAGMYRETANTVGSTKTDIGPFGHHDLAGNVREWLGDSTIDRNENFYGSLIIGGGFSYYRPHDFSATAIESVYSGAMAPVIGFRILVEIPE